MDSKGNVYINEAPTAGLTAHDVLEAQEQADEIEQELR